MTHCCEEEKKEAARDTAIKESAVKEFPIKESAVKEFPVKEFTIKDRAGGRASHALKIILEDCSPVVCTAPHYLSLPAAV